MRGYWNRKRGTPLKQLLKTAGFLPGDQADILPNRYLRIKRTNKGKLSSHPTVKKYRRSILNSWIETDPLFAQVMLIGDNRPFISALVVLNKDEWKRLAVTLELILILRTL